MLISIGGGSSSNKTEWNSTEPPGPGTRHSAQMPSWALQAGLQPLFSVTSHHQTSTWHWSRLTFPSLMHESEK